MAQAEVHDEIGAEIQVENDDPDIENITRVAKIDLEERPPPFLSHGTASIVSPDSLFARANAVVVELHEMIGGDCDDANNGQGVSFEKCEHLLREARWDVNRAVLQHYGGDRSLREYMGGRWRRIRGDVSCATCFEKKDADSVLVFSTDCGVGICGACWCGHTRANLSGGVNGTLRCPFPQCSSVVPEWLVRVCCAGEDDDLLKAHLVVYQAELMTDFVTAADDLTYCPYPTCNHVLQLKPTQNGADSTILTECGHRLCAICYLTAHFPADCATARFVNAICSRLEVKKLAKSFENIRRCSACGALVEAEGDSCDTFTCLFCDTKQSWTAADNCSHLILASNVNADISTQRTLRQFIPPENEDLVGAMMFTYEEWTRRYVEHNAVMQAAIHLATWTRIKNVVDLKSDYDPVLQDVTDRISTPDPTDRSQFVFQILVQRLYNSLTKPKAAASRS